MGLQTYLDVAHAPDAGALERLILKFAHERDFGLMSAAISTARSDGDSPYVFISNTPPEFLEAAHSVEQGRRDPVLHRLKTSALPFAYDQHLYVAAGAGDLWEHQAAYGYRCGLAVSLGTSDSRRFLLGLDTDRPLPKGDGLRVMMGDLTLLAAYAKEAMTRLYGLPIAEKRIQLTEREREVLLWLLDGRTSVEIGRNLSISERTVNFHVGNLLRKFDVETRHQAVAKAIRLGLIS